jgi:hypothetical protein
MSFRRSLLLTLATGALLAAGCGDDSSPDSEQESKPEAKQSSANLGPVKDYLTDHTEALSEQTAVLAEKGQDYYDLVESENFDYQAVLSKHRDEVRGLLEESQTAFRKANPDYEQMEGIVAGVVRLSKYDVILDAGSSAAEDPESAVPFDLKMANGKVLRKPGNFFFLLETSLWGTNEDFVAKGVKPDLDGDGRVEFGEALPDANFYVAASRDMKKYADELNEKAQDFEPTESDALSALVIMVPTMSEYFEAWKNSRFVAGAKAKEEGFVAASRLQDITDILGGLVLTYDGMEPVVRKADPQQATQTGESLKALHEMAAELRDKERAGRRFTPEEADTLGGRAQDQAEAIAGQITQAAAKLDIKIEEG